MHQCYGCEGGKPMNKCIKQIAAFLAAIQLLQCVPVHAAGPGDEIREQPAVVESELLQLQPMAAEPTQPTEAAYAAPVRRTAGQMASENLTWTLDDGVLTISGTGEMGSYMYSTPPWQDRMAEVTQVVVEEGITLVGSYAFWEYPNLSRVVLADTVTTVDRCAFGRCPLLTEVDLGEGLVTLNTAAFAGCTALEEIRLPDSLREIGSEAFSGCSALREAPLPEGLAVIAERAFRSCGLEHAVLPEGLTGLGNAAFSRCPSLVSITLPASVTAIPKELCKDCTALAQVHMPEGVTSIGDNAFGGCTALADVTIPSTVTAITSGENASFHESGLTHVEFAPGSTVVGGLTDCKKLTEVTIPETVTLVDASAFDSCAALARITLPAGLTSIGDYAFQSCTALTDVTVPDGVRSIGQYAFGYCHGLQTVRLSGSLTELGDSAFTDCGKLTRMELPDGLTRIGDDTFYNCYSMTELVLPENLTSIGSRAFYNCARLTAVELPEGLTELDSRVFSNCRSLTELVLPDSLRVMEGAGFSCCESLTQVRFGRGLELIGAGSFSNCTALEQVILPDTLTTLEGGVFSGCTALSQIALPDSMTALGDSVFSNCTALSEIDLPDSVTTLGKKAFFGCTALRRAGLGSSLTGIGQDAFRGCVLLEQIRVPETVTSIGREAFAECTALARVELPDGVTLIDYGAFADCPALALDRLPAGLVTIGSYAFENDAALTVLELPGELETIGSYAFRSCGNLRQAEFPASLRTIQDGAFSCTALEEAILPEGLTYLGYDVFRSCDALQKAELPDSLIDVKGGVFMGCSALRQVRLSGSQTRLMSNFFSDCTALEQVTIPDSVTSIETTAFYGCDAMERVEIPNSVTKIGSYAFCDCDVLSEVVIDRSVTSIDPTAFVSSPLVTIYTYPDAYAWTFAEENGIPVVNLLNHASLTLTVLDETGAPVTEGITIEWYRSGSDELLARGSSLRGVNKEDLAYDYRVVLDDGLARRYRLPGRCPVRIENECYDLTCTLTPIPELELSGRVVTEAGAPVAEAAVTLVQTYRQGLEDTLEVFTDADGCFRAAVRAVPTQVRILAGGFYSRSLSLDLTLKQEAVRLTDTVLTALPADRIGLTVKLLKPHAPAERGFEEDLPAGTLLTYRVENLTQGAEVTEFEVRLPWLYLGAGAAEPGDVLRITASDPAEVLTAAEALVTLDENKTGEAALVLGQRGLFRIERIRGNEANEIMIFDSRGSLAASGSASSGYTSPGLPAGSYRVVLLERSGLLRSVSTLDILERLGLIEGTDYAAFDVTVEDGIITTVSSVEVPALDESRLSYVDPEGTRLTLSRQSVYPEQAAVLQVSFAIDSSHETDRETVHITLPEGISLADDSVFLDREARAFTVEGNTLVIPVHQQSGTLSMYIRGHEPGERLIGAQIAFDSGSDQLLQPLGQVRLSVNLGKLDVARKTARRRISVEGVTMANRQVRVFVDGEPAAVTASNGAGSWHLVVDLPGNYTYSHHELRAEVAGDTEGVVYSTEPQIVTYDAGEIELKSITMYNIVMGEQHTTHLDFLSLKPHVAPYYYVDGTDPRVTYVVNFTGGDDTVLKNVRLNIRDVCGGYRTLDCSYSGIEGRWYAWEAVRYFSEGPAAMGVSFEQIERVQDLQMEVDSLRVDDIRQRLEKVRAESQAEFDAVTWEDDGSFDDMDIEELFAAIEDTLAQANGFMEEFDYHYNAAIEEMKLAPEYGENTVTTTFGGVRSDTTVTVLEELDEEALLARGYEKILCSDGSHIYRMLSENCASIIDPDEMTELTVTGGHSAAASIQSDSAEDIFRKTREKLQTANSWLSKLTDGVKHINEICFKVEDKLRNAILEGMKLECKNDAALLKMYGKIEELKEMGFDEEQLADYRRRATDFVDSSSELSRKIWAKQELLNAIRVAKEALKALPIISLALNIADMIDMNSKLEGLYNGLPKDCPGDRDGLEAIQRAITDLSWFIYSKIAVDMVMDLASIAGVFTGAALGTTVTGGLALPAAIAVVAVTIAASVASDRMAKQYVDIKYNEILDMIELLKCDKPNLPDWRDPHRMLELTPICDPSGYVYEAVPSNRVEGVRAEVFYLDGDREVSWNAEDFDQVNPVSTDAEGRFRWDVPFGRWLVKFSKEGYYDTDSRSDPAADEDGYLPVPPPQLQVNTAIVSKASPTVENIRVYPDQVLLIFSQYMIPETVSGDTVTLTCGGTEVPGTLEAVDAEWDLHQTARYARTFRFLPQTALHGSARITVSGARNYADVPMAQPLDREVPVLLRPEAIEAESAVSLACGDAAELAVRILPAEAGAGLRLTVSTNAPAMLEVPAEAVTDEEGIARISLNGLIPGTAELRLALEGTDLQTAVSVQIAMPGEWTESCAAVRASIPNGAVVAPGTALELTTATEGAEIYYTLDGTCPCVIDSPSRIHYTGPILLQEDTFLIAYAVKAGLTDSPTAGFLYTVCRHGRTERRGSAEPDCTTEGNTGALVCTDCETVLEIGAAIPALGHSFGQWSLVREPTFDAEGLEERTCIRCGHGQQRPIPRRENPFTDVAPGSFYIDPVLWAVEKGITNGATPTTFDPNGHCQRAAVVTFLWRAAGSPEPTKTENPFTDVKEGDFYYKAVLWAVENNITNGTTATTFSPFGKCNRAQVVTFLWRAQKSPASSAEVSFTDVQPGQFYSTAVAWAVEKNITNGMGDGTFGINTICNRAQVVTFLYRAMA